MVVLRELLPPTLGEEMQAMKYSFGLVSDSGGSSKQNQIVLLLCPFPSFLWVVIAVGSKNKCATWRLSDFTGAWHSSNWCW